tara:strand:+ start:16380 stop:16559 length:180 start_codon:yes stop_codon:yes gene_type:complete
MQRDQNASQGEQVHVHHVNDADFVEHSIADVATEQSQHQNADCSSMILGDGIPKSCSHL